jgi:filamentous hemagglutinin
VRGEQAATNAALRTELREALEADFKLYPGSAPTASVTILSADDVAQASARSAVTPNKFMYADGVAYRSDLKEHLAMFDGWPTTGKGNVKKTHVLGAHNMDEMYALEKTQGIHIKNKTQIGEGIYELEYWIPKKAGNGPLAGQVISYSKAQYPKTVYDPKVFSDDRIIEMAQKAASTKYEAKAKVFESNPTRNQYSAIYDGVNFQVYLAKDKSGNIYVSNAHPAR